MKQRKKSFKELLDYICESKLMLEQNPNLYRYIIDAVRCNIFYMTATNEFFTGKYSFKAFDHIRSGGKVSELCKEHHYSLKRLCTEIMYSNLSRDVISDMIKSKGTFNLTTKDENHILRRNRQSYEKSEITINTYNGWLCDELGSYPSTETEYVDSIPEMYVDWVEEKRDTRFW